MADDINRTKLHWIIIQYMKLNLFLLIFGQCLMFSVETKNGFGFLSFYTKESNIFE